MVSKNRKFYETQENNLDHKISSRKLNRFPGNGAKI